MSHKVIRTLRQNLIFLLGELTLDKMNKIQRLLSLKNSIVELNLFRYLLTCKISVQIQFTTNIKEIPLSKNREKVKEEK